MGEKSRYAGLVLMLFLLYQPLSPAQKSTSPLAQNDQERRSFAQNLARAINAAEADYFKSHQIYATWETLMGLGDFSQYGTRFASPDFPTVAHALYGSGPEIVPGWRLRLLVSKNEKSYDVSIEDVNDLKCGYAVITDERGKIRRGTFLECPAP
jgi:hypothetical protein